MHFMLEDLPRSLQKVFCPNYLNVFEYIKFSDLNQTLENFSEDSWKTLRRLLGKFSNAFYARRRPTKSLRSLPKFSAQSYTNFGYTLKDFSEDSWKTLRNSRKTLGRLLEKSCNVFYARRLPRSLREFFQSLLPKVVQRNDVKWRPSLSMLRNDI
ncbi:hypothetical protein IGI04_006947 [Brassica rapa subsp. trilocularis]|uniref:Uncharacterized protein n=1 Tax=Brassica rapa subsp. trilocularis TaxID=1813537 RepID=A0ABQ7NIB7_BRACM|nr:hypothetical protein IGI04_006947 [Brassica rapa subsp. trilocularis]